MKKSEIFNTVKEVLIEALGIEEGEEITPKLKLIDDLGAESIDFLDIFSRLERRFDVTLDTGEDFETKLREMVPEEEMETGVIPEELVAQLPELLPEIDPSELKSGLRLQDIPRLFSVDTLVKAIIKSLKEQQQVMVEIDM